MSSSSVSYMPSQLEDKKRKFDGIFNFRGVYPPWWIWAKFGILKHTLNLHACANFVRVPDRVEMGQHDTEVDEVAWHLAVATEEQQ